MEAELFLGTLFSNKPDSNHILIWQKRNEGEEESKVSTWFKDYKAAAAYVKEHGSECDTYVGCGTSPRKMPAYLRCKASDIAGIPGAWVDVDFKHPVHKKPDLPETPEKALEIIDTFPLKPTIIIHSGHGFHAWWIFEEFKEFRNDHDRIQAAALLNQFNHSLRDYAHSIKCDIDMTFDLARILRVPQSLNFKNDPAPMVRIHLNGGPKCKPSEFKGAVDQYVEWLGDRATPLAEKKSSITFDSITKGEFVIDPNAEPPEEKFEALMTFEPRFAASWGYNRSEFKDKSPSSYDMSLATFAANAEWEPQEIIDLIMAFRRKHGFDISRQMKIDYFTKFTLPKAMEIVQKNEAWEVIDQAIIAMDQSQQIALDSGIVMTEEEKVKADKSHIKDLKIFINSIFTITNIPVKRIIKYDIDPAEYKLETPQSCVHLGPVQNLIEQRLFRLKVADATGLYMDPVKKEKWPDVAKSLLALREIVKVGYENTNKGMVRNWLIGYLEHTDPLYDENDAQSTYRPFFKGNELFLFGPEFRRYIIQHCRENINMKSFGILLREYGFIPVVLNFNINKRKTSRSLWGIEIAKDKTVASFVDQSLLDNAIRLTAEREERKEETDTFDKF